MQWVGWMPSMLWDGMVQKSETVSISLLYCFMCAILTPLHFMCAIHPMRPLGHPIWWVRLLYKATMYWVRASSCYYTRTLNASHTTFILLDHILIAVTHIVHKLHFFTHHSLYSSTPALYTPYPVFITAIAAWHFAWLSPVRYAQSFWAHVTIAWIHGWSARCHLTITRKFPFSHRLVTAWI